MTATERLRERVRAKINRCPTCGRVGSQRHAAAEMGVNKSILSRFLSGKQLTINSSTFDAMTAWVDRPEL